MEGEGANPFAKPSALDVSISGLSKDVKMCSTAFILRPENVFQFATERPSDLASERSSDRATDNRASDRAIDRVIDGDRKSSSRSPFDTLTSALCSIFQNSSF